MRRVFEANFGAQKRFVYSIVYTLQSKYMNMMYIWVLSYRLCPRSNTVVHGYDAWRVLMYSVVVCTVHTMNAMFVCRFEVCRSVE